MQLKISNDFYKIGLVLTGLGDKVVKKATARSANKAAISVRAHAARLMKEKYNLPIGGSSKGGRGLSPPGIKSGILIEKARYSKSKAIGKTFALIRISNKPISLIHFVRGSKTPANQKGVAVKDRKKVRIAIKRGKSIVMRRGFILNAKGSIQLYRPGKGKGGNRIAHKQAIPSFFRLAMKPEIKAKVELFGRNRFREEMAVNLKFFAQEIKPR